MTYGTEHIMTEQTGTRARNISYSYDLLYDIKTEEGLRNEIDYLAHRLAGIAKLCREDGYPVDAYITAVLSIPNPQ